MLLYDLVKMKLELLRILFRAIKLRPDDARFHRFVLRERPSYPIEVFELTIVTFGDKPSPTAAIVTLRHVEEENAPGNGRLVKLVSDPFYMDNLKESVVNIEEALKLKCSLIETLGKVKEGWPLGNGNQTPKRFATIQRIRQWLQPWVQSGICQKTPENMPVNPEDKEQKQFHARNAKVLSVGYNAVPDPPVVDAD
ncbi:hypothetical protein HOLleu_09302 [Holothuria leucospilota]|uniref:Uncharacterized protein n=1 Tax=Holothuria leucospilota TaxID=206669 RepID=A0A9Q1CJJ7_HOLLE|nr:hypothetical protein HOLleu_09302 [Holothuria leucospilota]